MNILIGFGGLLIQLFQVIQNRIKKRGNNKEKDSKTRAKRMKSSTRMKEDARKQDSSRLLVQKNNFYHNSFRAIDLSTAASIPSNSLKPRVIMKTRKTIAHKIHPYHIPNSLSGLNTKPIHSQRKEMSQNSFRSAKNRGHKRLDQINSIRKHSWSSFKLWSRLPGSNRFSGSLPIIECKWIIFSSFIKVVGFFLFVCDDLIWGQLRKKPIVIHNFIAFSPSPDPYRFFVAVKSQIIEIVKRFK